MRLETSIFLKKIKGTCYGGEILRQNGFKRGGEMFDLWANKILDQAGDFCGSCTIWEKDGREFVFMNWAENNSGINVAEVIK